MLIGVTDADGRCQDRIELSRDLAPDGISQVGTQISLLALPLIAAVTLDASPFEVGLLAAAGQAPALVLGGTDARHYQPVSDDIYRFGPYYFEPGDLARAHGIDERTSVAGHADAMRFYVQLLRNAAQ